ncbi:hypothetical protein [Amphibacillus cookii]|uniref:hypothetical protein n=1 Tax=Amphibacillus cookii TaxID=767787 RepID=UPI001956720D|nr:hypothetical protein [Amphibacillus cookii]MBM7541626.1 hypothetical protein [Amphibacillus cookii]
MTISFEMAPKGKACRLVATSKTEETTQLTVLHREQGFIYFNLADLSEQTHDVQAYIEALIPNIEAGKYQMELVEMNQEEVCC